MHPHRRLSRHRTMKTGHDATEKLKERGNQVESGSVPALGWLLFRNEGVTSVLFVSITCRWRGADCNTSLTISSKHLLHSFIPDIHSSLALRQLELDHSLTPQSTATPVQLGNHTPHRSFLPASTASFARAPCPVAPSHWTSILQRSYLNLSSYVSTLSLGIYLYHRQIAIREPSVWASDTLYNRPSLQAYRRRAGQRRSAITVSIPV